MPNLPVVGKVPKGWVIAVVVVSGGVIGYLYLKRKSTAAAAPAATTSTATSGDQYPPDGTTGNPSDPYSTDPNTGMTYGDEQLYGGGFGGSGYGGYGYGGGGGGSTGTGTGSGPGGPPFGSNAAWATYVEGQLAGVVDPVALSAAVGVYLTGRPATSDQESLIDQCIAIGGYPPVAGTNGNPPGIVSGGGHPPGTVAVPNVVGSNWSASLKAITAAGLKPSPAAKPSTAKDPVTGESPTAGTMVNAGSTVTLTSSHR